MPIITSEFKPAWWLKNPHLQTIWGTKFKQKTEIELIPQRIELDDGDFIDILKTPEINNKLIVLILHGLEGCVDSHYVKPLIKHLDENGFGVYFMHFRGCSGELNRLLRGYSSNDSADLQACINTIKDDHQRNPFAVIGFSLGGSVALKWLGENAENADTTVGIAISVPFKLRDLHGFKSAEDYYEKCSSRQFLKAIRKPTLILHAKDDPFMWDHTAPEEHELSKEVHLELTDQGGHVGFISGKYPWKTEYWLDQRILQWLKQQRQLLN